MDLKDIIAGLFWLVVGNLVFYLVYPLFSSFVDGLGNEAIGTFALTDTMIAIGWGAYILAWIGVGAILPIYLLINGVNKD